MCGWSWISENATIIFHGRDGGGRRGRSGQWRDHAALFCHGPSCCSPELPTLLDGGDLPGPQIFGQSPVLIRPMRLPRWMWAVGLVALVLLLALFTYLVFR